MMTSTMTQTFRPTTNHLTTIESRQRNGRIRDAFFAACIMLATAVSLVSVSTASHAASSSTPNAAPTSQLAHR